MAKSLYSIPHKAFLSFNAGTGRQVRKEIESLLSEPFLKQKRKASISSHGSTELELSEISLYSLAEVLARSQTARDLRFCIASEKVYFENSFRNFCDSVEWSLYLPLAAKCHLRVRSHESRLFHESMLGDLFTESIFQKHKVSIVKKEEEALTTLYVDLHKNICTVSLSLAGVQLYQRGFREMGTSVAPLREDLAQSCIREALTFCKAESEDFTVETLWVPFGGTGTFIFEFLLQEMKIAPCLLGRMYALEKLPFFNEKNFAFIKQKAKDRISPSKLKKILYSDYVEDVCKVFARNMKSFQDSLKEASGSFEKILLKNVCENFFSGTEEDFGSGDLFIPINPPYGIRLHSRSEIASLYARIARRIQDAKKQSSGSRWGGFILCPSEETWSVFVNALAANSKHATYHVTQGGLDIRVCQFLLT